MLLCEAVDKAYLSSLSAYMSGFEMSSVSDWGVGGTGQVPSSGAPPVTCGANLGVSAPIAACDLQQS